jgi:hypothetical protein
MRNNASLHADQQGGMWQIPRSPGHATASAAAGSPRADQGQQWNAFLPISVPIKTIAALSICDMACFLSWAPVASVDRWRGRITAGPFH